MKWVQGGILSCIARTLFLHMSRKIEKNQPSIASKKRASLKGNNL